MLRIFFARERNSSEIHAKQKTSDAERNFMDLQFCSDRFELLAVSRVHDERMVERVQFQMQSGGFAAVWEATEDGNGLILLSYFKIHRTAGHNFLHIEEEGQSSISIAHFSPRNHAIFM
jgi:hypothetical protein